MTLPEILIVEAYFIATIACNNTFNVCLSLQAEYNIHLSEKKSIEMQSTNAKQQFQEKLLTIIGSLHHHGFDAKLFYEIKDFTKQVALVPCSGKTGEGISELIMTLCGISQKFLKKQLELGKEPKDDVSEKDFFEAIQQIEGAEGLQIFIAFIKAKKTYRNALAGKDLQAVIEQTAKELASLNAKIEGYKKSSK